VENGDGEPHVETLTALAAALEWNYAELVRPEGVPRIRIRSRVYKPVVAVESKPATVVEEPVDPGPSVPMVVAKLLCTGRLGKVKKRELRRLIRDSRDPDYAGDVGLLELSLLFRRACEQMHDHEAKLNFDRAFERIRRELLNE
jgi:hypothetical protein